MKATIAEGNKCVHCICARNQRNINFNSINCDKTKKHKVRHLENMD